MLRDVCSNIVWITKNAVASDAYAQNNTRIKKRNAHVLSNLPSGAHAIDVFDVTKTRRHFNHTDNVHTIVDYYVTLARLFQPTA